MNNNDYNLWPWWKNSFVQHNYYHGQQENQPPQFVINSNEIQYRWFEQKFLSYPNTENLLHFRGVHQTLLDDYDTTASNFSLTVSYDSKINESATSSLALLLMIIFYGLVVFGGVLGNATLVLTLCSTSSIRLRNPLLLSVIFADLLVTGISAPITLLNLAMNRKTRSLSLTVCKILHYIQVMPVAASTISFFMLSLDRYATVKHPRLAQLRQRRYLHVSLAILSWLTSAIISTPFLFAYKVIAKTVIIKNNNIISLNNKFNNVSPNTPDMEAYSPNVSVSCTPDISPSTVFVSFILFHTIIVFIIPGFGVLLNHYGVRQKLCALSLTERAAHGELPLPMPILRRQTHMVIVTGIANAQQTDGRDDTSNGEDIQLHNLNVHAGTSNRNVIKSNNPISPRAMREIRAHSQRQRINNNHGNGGPATPGIPLPQTSTLRSRRRLANMLITSAFIFIACWAPHVFCIFYKNLGYAQYCSNTSMYFNLLLGYFYSAISPVIYWALNHNTLRQSPCAPIIRFRSMQNFLRTRFRSHTVPPPPSSTNEAALGAFNPNLIKLTPKQYRAQASSHYLY